MGTTILKDPAAIELKYLQEYLDQKCIQLTASMLTVDQVLEVLSLLKEDLQPYNVYRDDQYSTRISLYSKAYAAIQYQYNIGNNL